MSGAARLCVAAVDDESPILESLESLLEAAGHTVHLFTSGADFLDSGALAQIDCLITDIGMPGMDGLELQRIVHAARPELPIIFLTGRPAAAARLVVGERGCRAIIGKPFNGRELLVALSGS